MPADFDIDILIRDAVVDMLAARNDFVYAVGITGTDTSGTDGSIIDTSKNFVTLGVAVGDSVENITQGWTSTVASVAYGSTLTLNDIETVTIGDSYRITKAAGTGLTARPDVIGFQKELTAKVVPLVAVEVEQHDGGPSDNVHLAFKARVLIHSITAEATDQDGDEARTLRKYVLKAMCREETWYELNEKAGLFIYENGLTFKGIEENDAENENGAFWIKTAVFEVTATTVDPDAFIFKVELADTSYTISLSNIGSYNLQIEWGDGSTSLVTAYNDSDRAHTYSVTGDYLISCTGTMGAWFPNGDTEITTVYQWGCCTIAEAAACANCTNLVNKASDQPTFSGTSLSAVFNNAPALTRLHKIMEAVTSTQTNLTSFLQTGGTLAKQSLTGGDWSSVTVATSFLQGQNIGRDNYNELLAEIASQSVQSSVAFHGGSARHSGTGTGSRSLLVNTYSWTITDGGAA